MYVYGGHFNLLFFDPHNSEIQAIVPWVTNKLVYMKALNIKFNIKTKKSFAIK